MVLARHLVVVLARYSFVFLKTLSLICIDNERESHYTDTSISTRLSLEMFHMLVGFEAILQSAQSEGVEVLHHRESVHRPNL